MGKSQSYRNCDKEFNREQRLAYENRILRKQIAQLRKQIARLNLEEDRYKNLKELVDKQYKEESVKKEAKKVQEKWQCFKCQEGVLKMVIYTRRDGTYYFRKCTSCENRTPSKKHTPDVEES